MQEIQRVANILPVNLLRTTSEAVDVGRWQLSKGQLIIPQISILMHDPTVFASPSDFNPGRFLENGQLRREEAFMPFSVGRRQCLGESLARAELFLVFANVIRRFSFSATSLLSSRRILGLTVSPPHYSLRVRSRYVDLNSNSVGGLKT